MEAPVKVADVMTESLLTAGAATSWSQLARMILEAEVSGIPVVDASDNLVGIVTEADLLRRPDEARLTAADVMTAEVLTATPDEDVRVAAGRMLQAGVKRLPVVEGRRLVGILCRRDLVGAFYRPDADIVDELDRSLATLSRRQRPSVKVTNGVVTLTGQVGDERQRSAAELLAWQALGVASVINLLEVDGGARPAS